MSAACPWAGADSGALVFEPSAVTVAKGETITFTNNAGFPHNVVFDEDAIPVSCCSHMQLPGRPGVRMLASAKLALPAGRALGSLDALSQCMPQHRRLTSAHLIAKPLAGIPAPLTQSGVSADAISHEDYLNGPGQSFSITLDVPGTYGFYCEPHSGAGMAG